jgi:glycosyltransferase involved in cell wall biosynthesis
VPVIVTDCGGPADIVNCHGSGIVVDHTRPSELTDAMERLCLSEELRGELRARGLRNAAESKWENVLESFWTRETPDLDKASLAAYRSVDPNSAAGMIELDLA